MMCYFEYKIQRIICLIDKCRKLWHGNSELGGGICFPSLRMCRWRRRVLDRFIRGEWKMDGQWRSRYNILGSRIRSIRIWIIFHFCWRHRGYYPRDCISTRQLLLRGQNWNGNVIIWERRSVSANLESCWKGIRIIQFQKLLLRRVGKTSLRWRGCGEYR